MTINGLSVNLASPVLASPVATIEIKETKNLSVPEYVEKYFSDVPVLVEVAKCESHMRQEDKNGEVIRGEVNGYDRGVMQINEQYHLKRSKALGMDILTLQGNLSYARHLFEKEGLQPWSASRPCWSKSTAYAEYKNQLAVK